MKKKKKKQELIVTPHPLPSVFLFLGKKDIKQWPTSLKML